MILIELSKLLKNGKIDRTASHSSQFLQLVDAVFDEAAEQIEVEQAGNRSDDEKMLETLRSPQQMTFEQVVKIHYKMPVKQRR